MLTFLVISYQSFRNGLSDGIYLGYMTTAINAYSDVYFREFFLQTKINR